MHLWQWVFNQFGLAITLNSKGIKTIVKTKTRNFTKNTQSSATITTPLTTTTPN